MHEIALLHVRQMHNCLKVGVFLTFVHNNHGVRAHWWIFCFHFSHFLLRWLKAVWTYIRHSVSA